MTVRNYRDHDAYIVYPADGSNQEIVLVRKEVTNPSSKKNPFVKRTWLCSCGAEDVCEHAREVAAEFYPDGVRIGYGG